MTGCPYRNPILEKLLDYAAEAGILPEDTLVYRDLLDTRIMGIITPPSQIIDRFNAIKKKAESRKLPTTSTGCAKIRLYQGRQDSKES